jgi:alpha-L-rhamnosidase
MFGSVGAWFYQALGGINAETPGYGKIRIEPQMARDLDWASASVETVRGTVACGWHRSPGTVTLEVTVPVNSTATVVIPKPEEATELLVREGEGVVWEDGKFVAGVQGVTGASQGAGGSIAIEVGSGNYSFTLTAE